jgi:serine/threonine protein kinase
VYRHYRIVLGTVGRSLEDFKCTREFVSAIRAALQGEVTILLAVCLHNLTRIIAHKETYNIGILHQDISPGNIMIADDDPESNIHDGILIDWDLSEIVKPNDENRAPCRTVS